jgi:hypothetical protein
MSLCSLGTSVRQGIRGTGGLFLLYTGTLTSFNFSFSALSEEKGFRAMLAILHALLYYHGESYHAFYQRVVVLENFTFVYDLLYSQC